MPKKKRKEDIRIVKESWSHRILIFSGFALLLFFLFNLSLEGLIKEFPYSNEIALVLMTALTASFIVERTLKLKKGRIYENFYSIYLTIALVVLTAIYWISFINNIEIGIFRSLIVLTQIIVFLYSLITISHAEKLGFIIVSYAFTAIITIILFSYIYWTLSIFDLGHLQFNECLTLLPQLRSENWFYFSSVTFYSIGYGDICPILTPARLVSQLEVAAGAIINTILIGFIFWKIREIGIETEIEKRKK